MCNYQADTADVPADGSEPPEQAFNADATRPANRPRIWTAFIVLLVAVVLAVLIQVAVVAGVVAHLLANGVEENQLRERILEWLTSSAGFLAMLVAGQVGFALPTLLAAHFSPVPLRERLGLVPLRHPVQISVLTALGSILPLAVGFGLVYLVLQVLPADETVADFFTQLTPAWGAAFVVIIALLPGFCEEMLFRGYIQRRLLQRWRPFWAIAVSTLLFTLAHVTPHAMAIALPLGAWFGVIAWRTGSIVPTIACHAFVNGGINVWRLVVKFGELSPTVQLVGNVLFVAIGVVCFVLACRMLSTYPTPEAMQPTDEVAQPAS